MGKSILTTNQSKLLESASTSELITSHFYLTGGTALSEFYFKHRISEDLDFFSEQEINDRQLTLWIKETSIKLKSETEVQALNGQYTYFFNFPDEVIKVDFAYFPFTMLGKINEYLIGITTKSIEGYYRPKNIVDNVKESVFNLFETLEDLDDVARVFSNAG